MNLYVFGDLVTTSPMVGSLKTGWVPGGPPSFHKIISSPGSEEMPPLSAPSLGFLSSSANL